MSGWDFGRGFVGDAGRDLFTALVDGFFADLAAAWRWITNRRKP